MVSLLGLGVEVRSSSDECRQQYTAAEFSEIKTERGFIKSANWV